jgi:Immunity protein 44
MGSWTKTKHAKIHYFCHRVTKFTDKMETQIELQSIWLTYFAEPLVSNKLIQQHQQIYPLLDSLNCMDYSPSIQSFGIIIVAFSPEAFPEPEKLRFRKSKNEIEIRINIDYEALLQANEAQTRQLIAKTYLSAISRFLSKRKDFDYQRFYEDVEKLFRANGFLD